MQIIFTPPFYTNQFLTSAIFYFYYSYIVAYCVAKPCTECVVMPTTTIWCVANAGSPWKWKAQQWSVGLIPCLTLTVSPQ